MITRKPKLIYCKECLTPLKTIKNIYGESTEKTIGNAKYNSNPIIDVIFICDKCGHESGDVVHQKDVRDFRINKLIN